MTIWPTVAADITREFIDCPDVAVAVTGQRTQVFTARPDAWSRLKGLVDARPGLTLIRAASVEPVYLIYPSGVTPMQAAGEICKEALQVREPEQGSLW